ncbi:MAG: alpha/beta hydrolase [Promethearchaeota archaeon]
MALEEIAKIRPDLAKLIEKDNLQVQKAAKEFALKKRVDIKDAFELKGDLYLINELYRYIDKYTAIQQNKSIPHDVKIEKIDANGVPAEWIVVPDSKIRGVIFYLFSGGYMWGSLETRRFIPYLLGRETKLHCLNIGYRLAPEHPFPAALEDSIKTYKWLLSTGISSNDIIIAGASAGGGLAVAIMLKLRDLGFELPTAAVLLSPWADLTCKAESLKTNSKFSPFGPNIVKIMAKAYFDNEKPTNPFISPVFADLHGLPPLLIQAGSIEILLDDSISLAERARSAGVSVDLQIWEGMNHVFHNFGDELPDSIKAIGKINKFIQNHLV